MARDIETWMRGVERDVAAARRAGAHTLAAVSQEVDRKVGDAVREISGIPTFPIEIRTSTAIYVDENGRNMGRVDFDFPDVVRTTDGRPVDVVRYELEGYKESLVPADAEPVWEVYGTSGTSTITRMELETYTTYVFRIRAADGLWSDAITVKTAHDYEPPPQPTAPQLTVSHGTITVKWDKLAVTGEMPADFSHIVVASGTASAPDKETYRLDMDMPFYVHTGAAYYTPVHFRFRAVDNSGNLSPWSEQATAFTTPLVDVDVILTEIDAGKTRIINAGKIALDANTTLDKKLKDNDAALAATNTSLTGPGGLTSRLATAEGKLANAGALVLADGKTLQTKLNENATAISNTDKALTGAGGVTERLSTAEGKLADVGALTYATGQTLRQKLTANDTALSTAQGQLTTLKDTTVPKLSTDLTAATGRLTTAEGKLSTAQSDLATAKTDIDAAEKAITDNAAVMNGAVTRLGTAEGEITSAKSRLTTAEGAVAALRDTTVPKLATDLTAATGRLTTAEGKLTTAEGKLATAQTDIDAAEKAITSNATIMNGAVTRLGTAEGEITAAKGRLTTAEGAVATLRDTTIPKLNTDLTAATGRLTTAEGKLTTAEGKLTTAQTDLTKLTNRVSPLETGLNTLTGTTIPAINLSINGKTTIVRSTSAAANPANYSLGDRWEKWSSLGTGGKLLQTWRHNSTAWVEEILDASYLPLVDIGSGTFGSLSGGRLVVGSVAADKVVIGAGENLLVDPSFEDPTISARRASSAANWSWVQDTLGGSYMTVTADAGDLLLGNSANAEMFPIDPKGALAFTAEFEGPDPQVYLQVRYADGSANTGPYLKTLTSTTKGTGKRTATVQWDFAGPILSTTGSPPVSARPILRARPGGTQKVYSVRLAPATKGELVVNGTITGDHVDADSVAAKVGSFLSLTTDQLVAGSATLGTAVAQKIAAGTAAFQTVDAKNLFVTGTSSLGDAVAKRLAAETGEFMSLTTNQLTAGSAVLDSAVAQKIAAATASFQKADISNLTAGSANMTQAVIDKLVANTAAFQKVTVDNITATATANLNTVVAQRIAAGTASFQTVDAKNLFVTGTSSLSDVVAQRLAAETGVFMSVTTDQLTAGAANINSLVAQKIAAGTAAFQKADISNLTAGTANMTQAVIDKLVANTAAFQKVTVDNITATSTANLNTVVAQRIAAGTASFQTVDAKNLFVTGTSSLGEAVAKRFAADTGEFLSLGVDQLKVTGTANMSEAVADKMFANIFATNKLTTNQLLVGKGENIISWLGSNPTASRSIVPHLLGAGVTVGYEGSGGRGGGPHTVLNAGTVPSGTYTEVFRFMPGAPARNGLTNTLDVEANTTYKASVWVRSGGTYPSGAPKVKLQTQRYTGAASYESASVVESNAVTLSFQWQELKVEFKTTDTSASVILRIMSDQPGHVRIDDPMMVKDGASLIATGGIVADHITASEELSAKAGQFLTLGVDKLTVSGTANLQTAVANKMFANIFATNRLTASQVLIGEGGNFLGDPNFLDPAGWNNGASWITALAGRNGNNAYVIPASTTQSGGYYGSQDRNRQFTVVPDAAYRISVWVKPDAAVPVRGVAMYMKWSTPDGPVAGTGFSEPSTVINDAALVAGVWTKISGLVKLPADAVKGFVGLYVQANANVRVAFSEPSVIQAVDQGLIVDNGILARHITASEEMSAKVGQFLKLNVTDLVATGSAKINEAVITKLFTETFATNKLTAQQVVIGSGMNVLPDPGHMDAATTAARNAASTMTVSSSSSNDLLLTPSTTATTYFRPLGVPQTAAAYKDWIPVLPGQVWKWGLTAVSVRAAGTVIKFIGRTVDGTALASPVTGPDATTPASTTLPLGTSAQEVTALIPADCYWIMPELTLPANTLATWVDKGSMFMTQVMDSSLIVDGAVTTKKLTVTEDMTVELLKVHKVKAGEIDVNSLTADTGFVGAMRTNILTADVIKSTMIATDAVIADLVKADAITAKHTITGALHRTAASGARTEMTKDGIRVLNASGIEQVKLGYGLETGLAVLNPFTSKMTALQNHVFGTQYLEGTFQSSGSDTGGVAGMGTGAITRVLKSPNTYADLTFTAYSDKVTIIITFALRAWLSQGLTTNTETIAATADPTIIGASGVTTPPYQGISTMFDYNFTVPYAMVASFAHTIVHHVSLLEPGKKYRLQMSFDNLDRDTVHSRIYWGGASAVIMPN